MLLGYSNKDMTDPYILFETSNDCKEYLVYKNINGPRFYARDYVNFQTMNEVHGGIVNHNMDTLTIETNAMLTFKEDYLLLSLKDNRIWRITKVIIADNDRMKRKSLRPRKKTIISLIGCDNDEW